MVRKEVVPTTVMCLSRYCKIRAMVLGGYINEFGMHGMLAHGIAFHRFKGAGANMQGNILAVDLFAVQLFKHRIGKMQTGRGRGYRSFGIGINGLIAVAVSLLHLRV